jgi:spore coat polysaccharide biosynthesis protein SpsF
LGSTRLPAKVLLPLPNGCTVLQEVLNKCRQIPGVDVLVAAIPDTEPNDILRHVITRNAPFAFPHIVRGPEHDVLARYAKAAREVDADVIMRITSDCPLIDPIMCHGVLASFLRNDATFACNDDPMTIPKGLNCEVFSREVLEVSHRVATSPEDREHVTPYMRRLAKLEGRFTSVTLATMDMSDKRWTLDTIEDYWTIWQILEARGA